MSKRREHLPRLSIAQNLNMQQPNQLMYSPALPTGIQQGFHPPYPMTASLQTPMQQFFLPHAPPAPGRPTHHPHQASMQLAAAGIHPPSLITPVASHFPRPSMVLGPNGQPQPPSHPFPHRSRRQLSIGGPPKAVLGGPTRKLSPLPPGAPGTTTPVPVQKTKKIIVNLPKETIPGEEGQTATRPSWARAPANDITDADQVVPGPELMTGEAYPPESTGKELPPTIDVYLPGKQHWDLLKKMEIEQKLEKLGVEPGSGALSILSDSHNRRASISSPADPALLLFKLNKLHQAQEAGSGANSLSVSPQPHFAAPFGLSPSPGLGPRFASNRHGHSLSLTQQPSYQNSLFSASPNFGQSNASVSEFSADGEYSEPTDGIHRPQGRVPIAPPPLSAVGGSHQIDFARGFGLDIPEESEEEIMAEEESNNGESEADESNDGDNTQDMELDDEVYKSEFADDDGKTTVPHSRVHSRHVSKLSAALSMRSVGGNLTATLEEENKENEPPVEPTVDESPESPVKEAPYAEDPIEEWTGSEDVYLGTETSDDESIGEFSNPSDEERARQRRVERRTRRRPNQPQQILDQPRRLPEFPRPPENTRVFHSHNTNDDDIISNPSEEENFMYAQRAEFVGVTTQRYYPEPQHRYGHAPIPMPHSRMGSGQFSVHDPAAAHSRAGSGNFTFPAPYHQHSSQSSQARRDSLNPFAKPFILGGQSQNSGSQQHFSGNSTPSLPSATIPSHSRMPSVGKPLNVAAPEFKPGSFNFRLPGAPQMPSVVPEFPRPQAPIPPTTESESADSSPFKTQGREKRQRRGSTASMDEGESSFHSFRFPRADPSPKAMRRSGSFSDTRSQFLNPSATPFTFAGFNAIASNMPMVPKETDDLERSEPAHTDENGNESATAKGDNSQEVQAEDEADADADAESSVPPSASRPKRAPLPLDFKHTSSGNTVPAGLFKALVNNGEERSRRGVRSRLSSREIFEHLHRPSMDDLNVASIAQSSTRKRIGDASPAVDDVFGSIVHTRRRSSLPDALRDDESMISVESSVPPQDLTTRFEAQRIESVISDLLDEKLTPIKEELARRANGGEYKLSSSTEAMMADVISLFRAQLQESATRSLEDSQLDARGELDMQMIKDIIEEGNQEILATFQHELHRIVQQLPVSSSSSPTADVVPVVEDVGQRTINAVVEAISELSARQEAVALNAPARERDLLVEKLITVLTPLIHSLRSDPIDYDFLTRELAQAVKPHISQLIDLASDKRETASLIVDSILPLLPSLDNLSIDTDAITFQLVTEVRRAIAPIDAHEIKEQVSELVVERLDSRLAVRDKQFNVDTVASKVKENIEPLFEPLNSVPASLEQLSSTQTAVVEKQAELVTSQSQIMASIASIPEQFNTQLEAVKTTQGDILRKLEQPLPAPEAKPDEDVLLIKDTVEILSTGQLKLIDLTCEMVEHNRAHWPKLEDLPHAIADMMNNLQASLAELITSRDTTRRELDEQRKLNTELQIQVTKARGSHGQVRVEKDVLNEKLSIVEGDRDRLRNQVNELQAAASAKATETSTVEARNAELQVALDKALARSQTVDDAVETQQRTISGLEASNKELAAEKQQLSSKVNTLNLELELANRDKQNSANSLESLQIQYDQLTSQQSNNWDVLAATSEKINMVFNLLENSDNEELHELRQHRDRTRGLENDNAALQKRVKDLEAKFNTSERAAAAARQSLTQAQQRSSEWERRTKESEGELELIRTKLEHAEQTQHQLDADYSMVKLQLEDREADARLAQDRENKLRDQISALESKCTSLQTELEKARTKRPPAAPTATPTSTNKPLAYLNGNSHRAEPPRPDSRASTIDGRENNRRTTPSYSTTQRGTPPQTQNQPSVWDSMHAPTPPPTMTTTSNGRYGASMHAPASRYTPSYNPSTPKARRSLATYSQHSRGAPSPTPSNVSAAPTQGDDGWWQ